MQVLDRLEHNAHAFTIEFRNGTFQLDCRSFQQTCLSMSSLKVSLPQGDALGGISGFRDQEGTSPCRSRYVQLCCRSAKVSHRAVTKVEWTNPHARFYVDVKEGNGPAANWNFELGSPLLLRWLGWNQSSLKVGDRITAGRRP